MLMYRIRRRAQKSFDWLRGWVHAVILIRVHRLLRIPVRDLTRFQRRIPFIERREYSQNGEDGIIQAIFGMIGTTNKYYVEFGSEDGTQCNTRYLMQRRWKGLLMDGSHENIGINLHKEFITAENIEQLFAKHNVPQSFDLLSIDIDGNDYWVWKAIQNFRPRVVIIEYNASFPWEESKTIPYKSDFVWDKTDYMGATLQALVKLGREKGYTLVATDKNGVNAFFVQDEFIKNHFHPPHPEKLYHPAAYKGRKGLKHKADPQNREWHII